MFKHECVLDVSVGSRFSAVVCVVLKWWPGEQWNMRLSFTPAAITTVCKIKYFPHKM